MSKNNPPAFPAIGEITDLFQEGMTLRDYFAGQALAGILAGTDNEAIDNYAVKAYRIADVMLERRNETD